MARIAPAPAQVPSTAATIGCGQARIARTSSPVRRVKASSLSARPASFISTSGPMMSCTSPPEQKSPPAPVSTTARTSSTRRSRSKVSASSRYDSKVSGFFRSGRSSVTVATRPATDQPKLRGRISLAGIACSTTSSSSIPSLHPGGVPSRSARLPLAISRLPTASRLPTLNGPVGGRPGAWTAGAEGSRRRPPWGAGGKPRRSRVPRLRAGGCATRSRCETARWVAGPVAWTAGAEGSRRRPPWGARWETAP